MYTPSTISLATCLLLTILLGVGRAATINHDFDIGWVYANPDGLAVRPVIGINGQWPVPTINVTKGDRVVINANNNLGNGSTSLHFHGLYMNGTTYMDGPPGVVQCDIPPDGTFTYNFTVDQPGTYWYHSHTRGQYPDGLRGPFIVNDLDSPYKDAYDEEIVLTFSDWYHDLMHGLLADFISVTNPTGAEPVPNSALMNETQNLTIPVQPGKTYMFRLINMGAFAGQYVWFGGHTMRIVEVDGIYTEAADAEMIYMTVAQRYSVLVTMRNDSSSNFAIVGSMDEDLFDTVPSSLNPNVTGWLQYSSSADLPAASPLSTFDPFDDFSLVPYDKEPLLPAPTKSFTLDMKMYNLGDGANYAFFNDVSYVAPKVPTLYTILSAPNTSIVEDPVIYGPNTNAYIFPHMNIIEIILNNNDAGKHPFHLHGHGMQVVARSADDGGAYAAANTSLPALPMKRDTVLVRPNGHLVLRFRADNPGVWLFHCHIEWHVAAGLVAVLLEAPATLWAQAQRGALRVPEGHYATCRRAGAPYAGNAAGNTEDWVDLTGANRDVGPLPAGFEARGIVAMVFSCVAAFVGMATVGVYGLMEVPKGSGA